MEPADNKPYIRETIEEKPRRPFWKKLLTTVFLAVTFGLIASCVFVFGQKLLTRFTAPTETEAMESVIFPPDQPSTQPDTLPPEESSAEPSGEIASESEEYSSSDASEATQVGADDPSADEAAVLEALVESLIEARQADLGDAAQLFRAASSLVSETNRSFVTVSITRRETDAFGVEYAYEELGFGVIVATTSREILILTPYAESALTDGSVSVRFSNRESAGAYMKSTDKTSGLAMLAVQSRGLSSAAKQIIQPITLGNSFICAAGQPVIAMGAPAGASGSLRYGILTYVQDDVSMIDNIGRVLHTDMIAVPGSCGFLINLSGALIGWFDESLAENGFITATGVSDMKNYLQNLSNGLSTAYLGIMGQTLTASLKEQLGTGENGVYILSCTDDGPAMLAGLMNGDIITQISGEPVGSMLALRTLLLDMNTEQTVKISVMRRSGSTYLPLEFDVHLERR